MILLEVFIFSLAAILGCMGSEFPLLNTKLGKIQGSYRKSYSGRVFAAFEGIPYAKPPVGPLRFEPPQRVDPWPGIWQADTLHTCIQLNSDLKNLTDIIGNEDCLYLNVYTPRALPTKSDNLDVIVHIHGGAFMIGYGHNVAGPYYVMDRDLVFVTMNYRLGLLGFLSTQDEVVPGNNGLKDQVLALKWVQEHISVFGGNPNSVTLDGYSAGSASVHFHYLSPLSEGLFHRGYSHSGVVLNPWSIQAHPEEKARKLADIVGCGGNSSSSYFVECMKTRPATELVRSHAKFFELGSLPFAPFGPVREKDNGNGFLLDYPFVLLNEGKINDVPWINSFTPNESAFVVTGFENMLRLLDENWNTWIHIILGTSHLVPEMVKDETSSKIRHKYLDQERLSLNNIHNLEQLFSDKLLKHGAIKASFLHSKRTKAPVYNIIYNYRTKNNFVKTYMGHNATTDYGVGHGDDIIIMYGSLPENVLSESDKKMKDLLLDLIFTYSKTNVPTISNTKWETQDASSDSYSYLLINGPDDIQFKRDKHFDETKKFWDSLPFREDEKLEAYKDEL